MEVTVGVSNHHVHVTEDDYRLLFGSEEPVKFKDLNQTGEFCYTSFVHIIGPKGEMDVRLMGPFRKYTQVEVSKTDAYLLGIDPPVVSSGNIDNADVLTLVGPVGSIERACAIINERHIHLDKVTRTRLGLENVQEVSVKFDGIKGGTLDHVYIKETPEGVYEMHIDTDDANALLLKNNDIGKIIL